MTTEHRPVSPAVRITTVTAVVVVALIAAVVSYSHMADLAHDAGEGWRSYLIPLSIDGLVVAASMVLLTRHRNGLPGGPLAWGALGAGVVASLAANMADARPEVPAVLIAGWPAAAFAVAFELLLQQRRADRGVPTPAPQDPAPSARSAWTPPTKPPPVPAAPAELVVTVAPTSAPPAPTPPAVPAPPPPHVPQPATAAASDNDPLEQVRQLIADAHAEGQTVGRRAVARHLNVSEHRARALLDLVGATTGPALNGTSGPNKTTGHQSGSQ